MPIDVKLPIIGRVKIGTKKQASAIASAVVAKLGEIEFKEGTLADAVADSIAAVANKQISGKEKFETVVKEFAPHVESWIRKGGYPALVADLTGAAFDVTRQFVQLTFNASGPKGDVQRLIEELAKRL